VSRSNFGVLKSGWVRLSASYRQQSI